MRSHVPATNPTYKAAEPQPKMTIPSWVRKKLRTGKLKHPWPKIGVSCGADAPVGLPIEVAA